jgi:streptogramin lyase
MSNFLATARAFSLLTVLLLLAVIGPAAQMDQTHYSMVNNWGTLPSARTFGSVSGISIDSKGHIWALDRCGANSCANQTSDPVLEFDASGKLIRSFGGSVIVFPHGIYVDPSDNVWVTDGQGIGGKGQQVFKFSPEGKVLLVLGKAGVAGEGPDTFNRPSAVAIASNGDIFVADGHHEDDSNARVVKFSKDGKFLMAWGKKGKSPGEFNDPHDIAIDSRGRVFVADRSNSRIQLFDQSGKFLESWTQFGRPSGIYIDKNDVMYVCDNTDERYPEWKRGIRVGSAKTGQISAFIPDETQGENAHELYGFGGESIVADAHGNIYVGQVRRKMITEFVKQ